MKTTIILSRDEVAARPQAERPLNYRVTSDIYHAVFEKIGAASMCWKPKPSGEFDADRASQIAVDLCFVIAKELERLGVDPLKINKDAPPLPGLQNPNATPR